jgi:hypothetical protein
VTPGQRHDSVCARPLLKRIRFPHRPGPAALQARPGHRGQGSQLPRLPCLPAKTRHCAHHPREDRPATAPAEAREPRRPTARVRPGDLPTTQHNRALFQPAQRLPRGRREIRKDRHFLRSGGHPRIDPALDKIRLKTDPSPVPPCTRRGPGSRGGSAGGRSRATARRACLWFQREALAGCWPPSTVPASRSAATCCPRTSPAVR